MRPSSLDPLFASAATIRGVGPKLEKTLNRLFGAPPRVIDLLFHLPTGVIDRRARPTLRDAVPGTVITVRVTVDRHRAPPPGRARAPYVVHAHDDTGAIALTYFNARRDVIEKLLPVGASVYVSGTAALFEGLLQMVHPDHVVAESAIDTLPALEPIYPLTEGLFAGQIRRAVETALTRLKPLPEWQEAPALPFHDALARLHRPRAPEDIDPQSAAWSRLAYDELLASQLALGLVRKHLRRQAGRAIAGDGRLRRAVIAALPYALTPSQARACDAITADLAKPERMLRLLQGDVGAGKTVVALLAAANVVEAGFQAALMAPTEILARQHMKTIAPLAQTAGLRVAILTGRERGRERAALLQRLAAGDIDLVVGTHALFQAEVTFNALALAIVDEQHRFGVHQRLALAEKGSAVDMLVLTATPIPRTLVLTFFGDMEISELREKPAGRKPIDTRAVPLERQGDVVAAVARAIASGERIYWVCPLVEESEALDVAAAQDRFEALRQRFGAHVDLVHGRMKGAEKDAAMARFSAGETRLLVATTVIEVGVDVPEATVMVIEHAERFGLAQLHQLRGRIGRGERPSTCILLYRGPLGEIAKTRLRVIRETEDGFRIAEEDLRLRGEGDVLGTRQSGLPGFRIARMPVHAPLLERARTEALGVLARDLALEGTRGAALRTLLHLFERQEATALLRAG